MKKIIRIGTYNIFHAEYVKEDIGAIGRALSDLGIEIAGLQEVDVGTERMEGLDTLRMIAEAGGYPYYTFSKALDLSGGGYGTAIVSRYPIISTDTKSLYSADLEPRAIGCAVIDIGEKKLPFFNTHVSYENREIRSIQLSEISTLTGNFHEFVLTGDFNTADLSEFSVFKNLKTVNPNLFPSFYKTESAIDHIFLTPNIGCIDAQMPKLTFSDHYPIWADVQFDQ